MIWLDILVVGERRTCLIQLLSMRNLLAAAASVEILFSRVFALFRSIILQEFPHAKLFCMACNAIFGAIKVTHNLSQQVFLTAVRKGSIFTIWGQSVLLDAQVILCH